MFVVCFPLCVFVCCSSCVVRCLLRVCLFSLSFLVVCWLLLVIGVCCVGSRCSLFVDCGLLVVAGWWLFVVLCLSVDDLCLCVVCRLMVVCGLLVVCFVLCVALCSLLVVACCAVFACVVYLSALVSGCLAIGVPWVLFVVCCVLRVVLLVVWLLLFVDCRMLCVDRFHCVRLLFAGRRVSFIVCCLMFVGSVFVCPCSLVVDCHVL